MDSETGRFETGLVFRRAPIGRPAASVAACAVDHLGDVCLWESIERERRQKRLDAEFRHEIEKAVRMLQCPSGPRTAEMIGMSLPLAYLRT